uniref:Uncharacterized protein n=1 Tax=Siphoviridae sp. ctj7f2 TaxID=2823593 RepID=A0A8S5L8P0_9CAUD|nr:MAG TPA: hypothetical protein [Siphoviridae sp. ctj7f2]
MGLACSERTQESRCDSCPGVKPVPARGFSLNHPQRLQDSKKI